ncbi:hypothetical protein JY651_41125 [Pyxidicoccus parkwayensis]|jgi:hypothetical protein|uniref:Uncharacterized protein n=2 Tax=Pyxidicoccus parkwayensis TaxID=2813578 RepID=A0ABX7PDN5_9BACT|nr:hypothetical protein JY651_41125 [Pyxidicoccus parkwaysis]
MPQGPARVWSIVVMSVLCTVLTVVLLRNPAPSTPPPKPEEPAPQQPLTDEQRRAMYRAWPLFEGWPLPQLPSGQGQGAEPGKPAEAPPEGQH